MHLLEALFQGAGAVNGVSWVLRHGNNRLDDIGLIDWLYCIRDRAAARAYRASLGKSHTVGETFQKRTRGEKRRVCIDGFCGERARGRGGWGWGRGVGGARTISCGGGYFSIL